ncbi:MAG TPA: hypothetical protein VIA29_05080 [Thermoanaerobaculia bacterium]
MALALLLMTVLAIGGLLATSVQGFAVAAGLAAGPAVAKAVVTRHVVLGLSTLLLSLFSQSMVIFFFIGTGKLVKEQVACYPEADRQRIGAALRAFKSRTSPPAFFSILAAIAVFVLGGAVHTRFLPPAVHLTAALIALALHGWALTSEWAAFQENNLLMDDPKGWLALSSTSAPRPSSSAPPRP